MVPSNLVCCRWFDKSVILRAVDVAMSTKVQDVFERNPVGHLRCSCDDCSFELVQRYPCLPRRPAFVCTGIALCGHPDSLIVRLIR